MKKKRVAGVVALSLAGCLLFGGIVSSAAESRPMRERLRSKGRIELDMNNDGDYDDAEDVVFDAADMELIADKLDNLAEILK